MADEADYVDVPGDCIHFPGFEGAKKNCLLCNPKPEIRESPGNDLRLDLGGSPSTANPARQTVTEARWVHEDCGDGGVPVEARYEGWCHICREDIGIGDLIVSD